MTFSTSNIALISFFIASLAISTMSHGYNFDVSKLNSTQNLVKAGDKYITLLGQQVKVGDPAPQFKVVDKNFSPVRLKDFLGQTVLISAVPSLDTGVCSIQTKRFNEEAEKLPSNITVLTISNDLPFAQKRFCDIKKIKEVKVLSDSVWRDFGAKYGLLIKDMGLLTRAVFIINKKGKITYKEIVPNISQHPDYDKALSKVRYTAPVLVIDTEVKTVTDGKKTEEVLIEKQKKTEENKQ
ncbi:thiol peroxidase [Colwellia sp. E2M01]|uniref:thiol peroxidase n=1 Tax=Colwellia sp. E2M01 TaxID=2841561 RepID=UPI001C0826C9|nr:thiol peroxidase [Colwellia sp. E2M01]MBU2871909.1 thiol peroxidase [Colwellia sp. E2M01]